MKSLAVRLANLGVILLFPGFFIYHLTVSAFGLPDYFQGLFGLVSASLFLSFSIVLYVHVASGPFRIGFYTIFSVFTLLYLILWTLVHFAFGEGSGNDIAVRQSLETIVLYSALFGVGLFFSAESDITKKLYICFFWTVAAALLFYVLTTGQSMFYANKIFHSEQTATYQGYGRSMMVVSVLVLAWTQKPLMRLLCSMVALLVLFILGARSELFGFAFFVMLLFSVMSARRYSWALLSFVGSLLFAAVVLLFHEWFLSNRAAQVLDLASASSWVARTEYMHVALSQISNSVVLGQFGGHVSHFGSEGSYSHNILSAWVNYGLLGFLMIFGLTIYAFILSVRDSYVSRLSKPLSVVSMGLNAVSLLLIIAAKAVFWPLVALGWGVYANSNRISIDARSPEVASHINSNQ